MLFILIILLLIGLWWVRSRNLKRRVQEVLNQNRPTNQTFHQGADVFDGEFEEIKNKH